MTAPTYAHAVALIVAILLGFMLWDAYDHRRKETPQERARRAADTDLNATPRAWWR